IFPFFPLRAQPAVFHGRADRIPCFLPEPSAHPLPQNIILFPESLWLSGFLHQAQRSGGT
ncbi:hypothetical protein, partial [Faecalibaculum rodentium]